MEVTIWVNLCGMWVALTGADKVNGNLAYNWLEPSKLHDLKEEFLGVKYEGVEYTVHKSCFQLRFTPSQ